MSLADSFFLMNEEGNYHIIQTEYVLLITYYLLLITSIQRSLVRSKIGQVFGHYYFF